MCLILLGHQTSDAYPFVLVANRDEFMNRPTRYAYRWKDKPGIYGGRDLKSGGTWLALSNDGRLAAVTNYRDSASLKEDAPSRGALVTNFLESAVTPSEYLHTVRQTADSYNGFNLIVWEKGRLGYFSNRNDQGPMLIDPGIHGLSNSHINSPWPKVSRGKALLERLLSNGESDPASFLKMIYDSNQASDDHLPDTGVGLERERVLSSMFIRTEGYGTRSSTVVLVRHDGELIFVERNFDGSGKATNTSTFRTVISI
ncbi:MAG: NRDE family protein [Rhodothermia bacterium]|nr:MAG: NRDE family protein [Rhodothermia bacterium]